MAVPLAPSSVMPPLTAAAPEGMVKLTHLPSSSSLMMPSVISVPSGSVILVVPSRLVPVIFTVSPAIGRVLSMPEMLGAAARMLN